MTTFQTQPIDTGTLRLGAWHIGWIFLLVGIFISGYLSYSTLAQVELQCVEMAGFDCAAVQDSAWSRLFGIPVALLGFISYIVIALIWTLEKRTTFFRDNGLLILFGLGLIGWLFSIWLLYVQAAIIGAFCPWCLLHECNFTLLFGLIALRLWRRLRQ